MENVVQNGKMMAPVPVHRTRIADGESIFRPFIDYSVTNSDKAIISHEIASAKIIPNCDWAEITV